MSDDDPPLVHEVPSDAAERSLINDVRQLVDDGRTLLEAELAYQKSRALVAGAAAKGIAGWGALALALVFFALTALVIGGLIGLIGLFGPLLGTMIAFVTLLLAAALSALLAKRRWERTQALLSEEPLGP
jgi:hypothetical protein